MRIPVGVVFLTVALSACGSKSPSAPSTNTPPTPTVTGLSIGGGGDVLRTRQTQSLTATTALSNGTTQAASSPTWESNNALVASVSSSGVVTANNQGRATISVTAQGQTASLPITVWQDYQGTWTGQYRIRVCTASGAFSGSGAWCTLDVFGSGQILPIRLVLTQQNGTAVNGSIELGTVVGAVAGTVYDSRHFIGAGSASLAEGLVVTFTIGTIDILASSSQLAGSFIWSATVSGFPGQGYNELDLVDVTRTSALSTRRAISNPSVDSLLSLARDMRSLRH
jgi:hypothetical protein